MIESFRLDFWRSRQGQFVAFDVFVSLMQFMGFGWISKIARISNHWISSSARFPFRNCHRIHLPVRVWIIDAVTAKISECNVRSAHPECADRALIAWY